MLADRGERPNDRPPRVGLGGGGGSMPGGSDFNSPTTIRDLGMIGPPGPHRFDLN